MMISPCLPAPYTPYPAPCYNILIMSIPDYPLFKLLGKEDMPSFDAYFKDNPIKIADYTFSNSFIWRRADKNQLTLINGNICILVTGPDGKQYFMMPLGREKMADTLKACLKHTGNKVIRLSEDFVSAYLTGNKDLEVTEDRDNFDYIYLTNELIELKGKKFDGKRNHINAFLKTHEFLYEDMTPAHTQECAALNELWCAEKKKETELFPNIECEAEVVKEALNNFEFLGVTGGIIKVNGKIEAFSIGQKLNADTAVIHIEKANPSIRGLAQLINREFARNAWADTTYINREQDMGHPGLRKAKSSYHPVKMEKKYNIGYRV